MNSELIPLMVALPILTAVFLNLIHGRHRMISALTMASGLIFLALPYITSYGTHTFGAYTRSRVIGPLAAGIIYTFESYQKLILAVLFLVVYLIISTYLGAFKKPSGVYLGFIMLSIAGCAAILLTDDFFNLYVFLEITIISQTALAVATSSHESLKSAVKYLIVGNVCGNCLLLAITLLLAHTGSLNIQDMRDVIASEGASALKNPILVASCALAIFAWAYATGMFPFHNLKSEIYAAARPHASALMQMQSKFIMIALGLILLRIFPQVNALRPIILYLGILTMVFGVVMALKQDNYQRMLSYHAISQAGYVACGLGIGTAAAIAAAIYHAINNALFKSALFIGCESVQSHRKTLEFSKLGGLLGAMPLTAVLILAAKLAISGVPPFNGFSSKLMLISAAFDANLPEVSVIMLLASVLTFISMMKAFHLIFMRPAPQDHTPSTEGADGTRAQTIVLIVLVGLCILLGVFPQIVLDYAMPIAQQTGLATR